MEEILSFLVAQAIAYPIFALLARWWRHIAIVAGLLVFPYWTFAGVIAGGVSPTQLWRIVASVASILSLEALRPLFTHQPSAINEIVPGSIVAWFVASAISAWRTTIIAMLSKGRGNG